MEPSAPDQKQSVRRHFGAAAPEYAVASVHRAGPDLDSLVAGSALRGDERVLDVGCGAGHTALALAPRVSRVDAIDLTPAMLNETNRLAARAGVSNLHTRLGDAEALPYADAQFDLVACRLCAHHFQRPDRAVREMARVLVAGGRLVLIDIVAPEAREVDTFLNAIELVRDPSHVRDYTIPEWRGMLEAAGLAVGAVETHPMRIDFEAWLVRIGAPPEAGRALRWMFGQATREAREFLEIGEGLDFTLTNAVLRATKPLGPARDESRAPGGGAAAC